MINSEKIDIRELSDEISSANESIKSDLETHPSNTRVIFFGLTGSGKTSLMKCLLNESVIARLIDGMMTLEGEGIETNNVVGTEKPRLYFDKGNQLLYCDTPGSHDLRGIANEIMNSFVFDSIFSKIDEHDFSVKMLFVISEDEINAGRCQFVMENIQRIQQIFQNDENMKKCLGIVFSKVKPGVTKNDLLNRLKKRTSENLRSLQIWWDFFQDNQKQVFLFPHPQPERVDQEYTDFEDKSDLINFLKEKLLINPEHHISLNQISLNILENMEEIQKKNQMKFWIISSELF